MDDILTNSKKIEELSSIIEELVGELENAAIEKANGKANYSKARALNLLKLKNNVITEFEGQKIENLTAGERQVIADGLCWKEDFDKDASDNLYKALITKIDARKAQMNGYQSINKVLQ